MAGIDAVGVTQAEGTMHSTCCDVSQDRNDLIPLKVIHVHPARLLNYIGLREFSLRFGDWASECKIERSDTQTPSPLRKLPGLQNLCQVLSSYAMSMSI